MRCYCKKCNQVVNAVIVTYGDLRCPICSSGRHLSVFNGGIVRNKLYGSCDRLASSYVVPNGVEEIEEGFFRNCTWLETVSLPSTLKAIPDECFYSCERLKSVIIPNSVRKIGKSAFKDCSGLKTLIMSSSLTEIGDEAFRGCSSAESITLPSSLRKIGNYAFSSCGGLKNVPSSVSEIGEGAFWGCEEIRSLTLSSALTRISDEAFYGCKNLVSISFPSSITVIGEGAFEFCSALTCINLPSALRKIDKNAFSFCKSLTSVILPDSLTEIGEEAFAFCWNLSAIRIGNYVSTIGKGAFPSHIKRVYLPKFAYRVGDDAFSGADISRGCSYGAAVADDVVIAEGTLAIPPHAFDGTKIKTLSLPDSVTEIWEYAFANCEGIKILHMPSRLKKIGKQAFSQCEAARIALPGSVTDYALDAFSVDCVVTINGINAEEKIKRDELNVANDRERNVINEYKQKIRASENRINEKDREIEESEKKLTAKEKTLSEERANTPNLKAAFDEAKRKLNERAEEVKQTISALEGDLTELEDARSQLEKEYKDTFFLNLSKRGSISQLIAAKEQEIQAQKEKLSAETDQLNGELQSMDSSASSAEADYRFNSNKCIELENEIAVLRGNIDDLKRGKNTLIQDLSDLETSLDAAEKKHLEQEEARRRELESIRQKAAEKEAMLGERLLLNRKKEYLESAKAALKDALRWTHSSPEIKHSNPDEKLLNESYNQMLNRENASRMADWLKKYLSDNHQKLDELREINLKLGLAENDGLDSLLAYANTGDAWTEADFPKRVTSVCKLFEGEMLWKELKESVQRQKHKWKDVLHKKYFTGLDCTLLVCNKKETLVFLPYCVVCFGSSSDMAQLFYDGLEISIEYSEFESEKTQKDCEEIGNHYLHANKDGSPNMRFTKNPLIHQWRKNYVTIKAGSEKHSFFAPTKNDAESLKESLIAYVAMLNGQSHKEVYQAIKEFESIDAIEQIIDSYIKHIEEKSDLEKERRIAERQKAEREAEEKRRKLIAKQRERNTEKRFDEISASQTETSDEMLTWQPTHEEKKHEDVDAGVRAYPAVADAILDQTHAFSEQPQDGLILDSNVRTVHNNIFSLDFMFRGDSKSRAQGRSVFMCDAFGNVISDISTVQIENKKKLRLTMTLKQNSFSKKEKYYLAVVNDASGEVESITEFKIDIAFSNIFDDGFGF